MVMSILGIASSIFGQLSGLQNHQAGSPTPKQQFGQEFQQLGQDLQAGNLSQAQQDFASLAPNASNGTQGNGTIAQVLGSLGQALQSGNLSGAQQAFSTIQQDLQQLGSQGHHHHPHHPG